MAKIIENDFQQMRQEIKRLYALYDDKGGDATARIRVETAVNVSNSLCKSHITEMMRHKFEESVYRAESILMATEPNRISLKNELLVPGNKKKAM